MSSNLRVLVADDNVDAAHVLALVIESLGHEARIARDGPEALAALEGFDADLCILDIGMPGMSGHEVARTIRRDNTRVYLVALSGWCLPKDRAESAAAGFDEHYGKPASIEQIEKLLVRLANRASDMRSVAG